MHPPLTFEQNLGRMAAAANARSVEDARVRAAADAISNARVRPPLLVVPGRQHSPALLEYLPETVDRSPFGSPLLRIGVNPAEPEEERRARALPEFRRTREQNERKRNLDRGSGGSNRGGHRGGGMGNF